MGICMCTFAVNTYSITVVQILKLCKMYDGVINNTAVQSTDIPMTSMLLNLVMMFVIAAIFMLLAILCIKIWQNAMEHSIL